jgi:hypothetical protein
MEEVNRAEVKALFKTELTEYVANGWRIEIENEYDAVLSKKRSFNWILHIILLIVFSFFFPPLAFLWLFVMVIIAMTQRSKTRRVWIDPEGQVQSR